MSRNVVEKLLYQLCVARSMKQRFKEDSDKLLERYALTEQERHWVQNFDVAALQKHGVHPMLTMGFWQENAHNRSPVAYMKALRPQSDASEPVFSAALKQ